MKFADIGQQLRAYRMESGMRAEEIAARLGVSRAALYRYEKGEVIKLETIRRLAELLKVSPLSLLGIGIEYFARPGAFQERLRGLEEDADQILTVGGAFCYAVTGEAFDGAVAEAWTQAIAAGTDRAAQLSLVEQTLGAMAARKRLYQQKRPTIIAVLSETALVSALQEGVAPGLPVPEATRARCREAARREAENIAGLMESVPIGLQLGLAAGAQPTSTFMVLRGRERANIVSSAIPADTPPGAVTGVAGVTASEEAVAVYQRVAEAMWRDAAKGAEAAQRVRNLIARHG
jgi:transcriptional regulator with XRE-family HTH domain